MNPKEQNERNKVTTIGQPSVQMVLNKPDTSSNVNQPMFPSQVGNIHSSRVYTQVIGILRELSQTGNVQNSLQKIDLLISGL